MKQCLVYGLLCAALFLTGCASQPKSLNATVGSSGPEILLPGGGVEEARLLAMGMARSKGWRIAETTNSSLRLERSLARDAPQAQRLSPDGVLSDPKLEVETRLRERGNDVVVDLSAFVITNPGTEQERRIDYTSDYQDQLLISLNALASAWLENRTRIASEIPLPPDPDTIVVADGPVEGALDDSVNQDRAFETPSTIASSPAPPVEPLPQASAQPTAQPPAQHQAPAASGAAIAEVAPDPVPTSALATIGGESDRNEMLVLDGQARRGLWTFYAEASARERGCAVGERGAVLLSTTTAFELYEVQCNAQQNLLLRCQGGVCREID